MARRKNGTNPAPVDMAPTFRYLSDELSASVLRAQQCGSHVSASARWYCWQSHPGAEFIALLELSRQGFVTHLPLFCDRHRPPVRVGGRMVRKPPPILPLFPGYGFVAFDMARDRWRCTASTRGVKQLFSYTPERPLPVPAGVVERLIWRCGTDGYIDDDKPVKGLIEPGTPMKILDGPFTDFVGICQMSTERRVTLLVEIMGRSAPVEVERYAAQVVA